MISKFSHLVLTPTLAAVAMVIPVAIVVVILVAIISMVSGVAPLVPTMVVIPITVPIPKSDIAKVKGDASSCVIVVPVGCSDREASGTRQFGRRERGAGQGQRDRCAFQKYTHIEIPILLPLAPNPRATQQRFGDIVSIGVSKLGSDYTHANGRGALYR